MFKEPTMYQLACNFCEKIFPISPPESIDKKYKEAIKFSHLKVTPRGAFSLAIIAPIFIIFFSSFLLEVFNLFSLQVLFFILFFGAVVFYLLYDYPMHYASVFKIKATSEMALCIFYVSSSMRVTYNFDSSIKFASENLTGPLGYDLREILWGVYSGKYRSIEEGLNEFIDKWKRENEEFTEALNLIRLSSSSPEKMESILEEAGKTMLEGTKIRMKEFSRELITPITVINALGILLPMLGILFFPIMSMFLPEVLQPFSLAVGYTVFLPLIVYLLMKSYLEKRPYSFHQPDISAHPKFKKERILDKNLFLSFPFVFSIFLIFHGINLLSSVGTTFSSEQLYFSLIVTIGISSTLIYYLYFSIKDKLKLRNEIEKIESELPEVLFSIGSQLSLGVPLEKAFVKIVPKVSHLSIKNFIQKIIFNINTLGMDVKQAIFDKEQGAINFYPSRIISVTMKIITEMSEFGSSFMSKVVTSISKFLKDIISVEEYLKDMLTEVTSSMTLQSILLAPLSTGVAVALAAIVAQMLTILGSVSKLYGAVEGYGASSAVASSMITIFINVNNIIPIHILQIVIGIYLIETVSLITLFLSRIINGEENIIARLMIAKRLIIAMIVYIATILVIYLAFSTIMPIEEMIK